jgi:hypothetical protein
MGRPFEETALRALVTAACCGLKDRMSIVE